MSRIRAFGLAACILVAGPLVLLVFRQDDMSAARVGERSPVALSVPVEIIRDGEDPSLREIEVRPR